MKFKGIPSFLYPHTLNLSHALQSLNYYSKNCMQERSSFNARISRRVVSKMNTFPDASTSISVELLLGFACNAISRLHFRTIDFLRKNSLFKNHNMFFFFFSFYLFRRGRNVYDRLSR